MRHHSEDTAILAALLDQTNPQYELHWQTLRSYAVLALRRYEQPEHLADIVIATLQSKLADYNDHSRLQTWLTVQIAHHVFVMAREQEYSS